MYPTATPTFRITNYIKHTLIIAGFFLLVIPSPAQCIPDSVSNTRFCVSKGNDYFRQYNCADTTKLPFSPSTFFDSLGVISLYEAQRIACVQFGIEAADATLYVHDDPTKNTWEVRGNYRSKLGGRGPGNATVKYTAIIIDINGQAKAVKRKHRALQDF